MLPELVDDSAHLLLACLSLLELAAAAGTCQRLAGHARDNSFWSLLCRRLWHAKLVPQRFVNLLKSGKARDAYRFSLTDSCRSKLASRELTQLTWHFRFKATAGEAWTASDPWWGGSPARTGRFRPNGTFQIGPTRLKWRFARLPPEERRALDTVAASARGEALLDGELPVRTFGSRAVVACINGQEVPVYVVRRHPGTWGWIMESCWVLWTSWPMPLRGSSCPTALELDDEKLPVTFVAQEMQAMSFNMGFGGSGPVSGDERDEAASSGSDAEDAAYCIAGQQAPAESDDEDGVEDDDDAEDEQEVHRNASQFVFVRAGPRILRIPRALFDAMTEEDLRSIMEQQQADI